MAASLVCSKRWQIILVQVGYIGAGGLQNYTICLTASMYVRKALIRSLACRCLVVQNTPPRGIIEVNRCLSIKGAEDTLNKPFAFEISTTDSNMFFIADNDKDKEDWINAVGRAIVRHSRSMLDRDQVDYTS